MLKPATAALTGGLLCALALLAGATAARAVDAGRASWQAKFERPAEIPFPVSNPFSEAKAKLGQMLFFDPLLSGAQNRSCATCHNPGLSWTDNQPRAVGEKMLPVRSPTLLNVAWTPKLGWDGHFRDLE